jgi:hypothetical protein
MARLGSFDTSAYLPTSFDVTGDVSGWMDRDFIPFPTTPPVPPTPPRPPPIPFGGAGVDARYQEPEPCVVIPVPEEPKPLVPFPTDEPVQERPEEKVAIVCPTEEPEADYAVFPIGEEAKIKALEAGQVEHKVTPNGELAIVLYGESGTAYLYANVGRFVGDPRHVEAGEVIGFTKKDSYSSAVGDAEVARSMLGAAPEVPVTFTEAPTVTAALPANDVSLATPAPVDLSYLLEGLDPPKKPFPWGLAILGIAAAAAVVAIVVVVTRPEPVPEKKKRSRKRRR